MKRQREGKAQLTREQEIELQVNQAPLLPEYALNKIK